MNPKITIVLAAYRSAEFIGRTLDSICGQTCPDFTCLIADDCSDDGTLERIRDRVGDDPRFVLQKNPQNIGWVPNVNQLLDQVKTPYFMIMPHDDELRPDYLMKTMQALENQPEAIGAYTDLVLKHSSHQEALQNHAWAEEIDPVKRGLQQLSRNENWWIPYRALIRWNRAKDVRLRKHPLGEFEADLAWLLDLGLRGPMVRIPEQLYEKHHLPNSLSRSWRQGPGDFCSVSLVCFQSIWESKVSWSGKIKLTCYTFYKMAGSLVHALQTDTSLPATRRTH